MNDRQKEKIELLERKLLKANRIPVEELREIVSAPHFLDGINARIKAEKAAGNSNDPGRRSFFAAWSRPRLAFAGLAVVLAGVLGFVLLAEREKADFVVVAPPLETTVPSSPVEEIGEIENPPARPVKIAGKTIVGNKVPKSAARNRTVKRPVPREPKEIETEFIPLVFAGDLEEAKAAGQVIRVELTRPSLLALGFDLPADNDNLKVKTDLLVGSDGVARGIRFVK